LKFLDQIQPSGYFVKYDDTHAQHFVRSWFREFKDIFKSPKLHQILRLEARPYEKQPLKTLA